MSDHDSPPISRDNQPGTVLLRLLAGGMSVLLFSVAGYIYVSVPPEWSFDYVASMALSLCNAMFLLSMAFRTLDKTLTRVPPPVTKLAKPVKPIFRVLAGIVGVLLLAFPLFVSYYDAQDSSSDRFSSFALFLTPSALFLWVAINGREMDWQETCNRFWPIFMIFMGLGWTLDGLLGNKPTNLGIGLPLLCLFLFLYFALCERDTRTIPAKSG